MHNIVDINNIENHSYEKLMKRTNVWIAYARYVVDQKWVPKLKENNKPVPENIKEKLTFCNPNYGAELLWIQSVQRQHFSEIFTLLEKPRAKV